MKIPQNENLFSSSQPNKSSLEILILYNSLSAIKAIVTILNNAGFKINWQQVTTTPEYNHYLSNRWDLILYYANLTQPNLREAISLLLERDLPIPLLVIDGETSIPQAVAAIKLGATDYLSAEEVNRLPTAVIQALAEPNICSQLARCTARSERQLQQLITNNADGIIVVNEQGIVRFVNNAALELLGKSQEALIDEPFGFPVVNGDYLEVDIPQTQGKFIVAQMRVSQIQWQGANAYIVSLRNITKIKQVEEERAKLLEEAQSVNRAKDEFLAVLSHELRTPLNPIVGWSQLLQSGTLGEAQMKKGAEIIQRNAMLQAQLIEDILDISRIIRGKLTLQAVPVELNAVIYNALDTINLAATAKSIHINTDLDENVGTVKGDPTRLQQVIWNLLSNAIKFTPHGGRVNINSTIVGDAVRVEIQDTGKGIEPNFLPYVFDYFRQAESAKTRANGGLGLGLAIVRHLIELHGGTITVHSPGLGRGATFAISLPRLNIATESLPSEANSLSAQNLQGIKILVVDDDDSSRELLNFILQQEGAVTLTTTSAIEALTVIEQFQPNILVSDIAMPEMDGYELIKRVRGLTAISKFAAIALSAYASDADRQKSLAVGFDYHINKPLDVRNFLQVVTELAQIK